MDRLIRIYHFENGVKVSDLEIELDNDQLCEVLTVHPMAEGKEYSA